MYVRALSDCKQIVNSDNACIIATLSLDYPIEKANFLSRIAYESPGELLYLSHFIQLKYVYKINNTYLCLVTPIKRSLKVVYLEVVDQTTGASYVMLQRHAPHSNPYDLGESRITVFEINPDPSFSQDIPSSRDQQDTESHPEDSSQHHGGEQSEEDTVRDSFIHSILELARDQDKTTENLSQQETNLIQEDATECSGTQVKSVGNMSDHHSFCKPNNSLTCITGIFYQNKAHWDYLNSGHWVTPTEPALTVLKCSINFPLVLRSLHFKILEGMTSPYSIFYGARFDSNLKIDKKPHMYTLEPVLHHMYDIVFNEVIMALVAIHENSLEFYTTNVHYIDYNDSLVVIERNNVYSTEAKHILLNPLSPIANKFYAARYNLENYASMLRYLGPPNKLMQPAQPKNVSEWITFYIQDGEIKQVHHANSVKIGHFPSHREDIFELVNKLFLIQSKLTHAEQNLGLTELEQNQFSDAICKLVKRQMKCAIIACYLNTNTGLMYVDFALFPNSSGIVIDLNGISLEEVRFILDTFIEHHDFLSSFTHSITS